MIYDLWPQWVHCRACAPEALDTVARFQQAATIDLAVGRHDLLEDRVYAMVSETRTRSWGDSFFETHRDYADVHALLSGREDNAWAPPTDLKSRGPYNPEKDCEILDLSADASTPSARFALGPDRFVFYAPGDPHAPLLHPLDGEPAAVRKIVYKIHRTLLERFM